MRIRAWKETFASARETRGPFNSHDTMKPSCPRFYRRLVYYPLLDRGKLNTVIMPLLLVARARSGKLIASLLSGGWFRFSKRDRRENGLLRQLTLFIQEPHCLLLSFTLLSSLSCSPCLSFSLSHFPASLKAALLRSKARAATCSIWRSSGDSRWTSH